MPTISYKFDSNVFFKARTAAEAGAHPTQVTNIPIIFLSDIYNNAKNIYDFYNAIIL